MSEKNKTTFWEKMGGYMGIYRGSTSGLNESKKPSEEPTRELLEPKTNVALANEALKKIPANLSKYDFRKETEKIRKKYPI